MTLRPPKALRDEWYKKLKEQGFEDIEDINSPREMLKTWHSRDFARRFNEDRFSAKQEYFLAAVHLLERFKFETALDKEIWTLHADGKSLREIAAITQRVSKDGALKVIRRIQKYMTYD